jgi:futalosine hydrolase
MNGGNQRILVIVSVDAEREAVLRGLRGDSRFTVLVGGVGQAATAASTASALAKADFGLVVSAGIAGGFPDFAPVGSLVVANSIVAADLGAETPEGFLSLDELGFGSVRADVDAGRSERLLAGLLAAGLPAVSGPVLTVSTVTGTGESAARLAERVPGAAAEAMEGYGVAAAAVQCGVPVIEVRAVSNAVGPRDRTAWRIADALHALEQAGAIFSEVLP